MLRKIRNITLFVKDYDEAVAFYTEKLGFEKVALHLPMKNKKKEDGRNPQAKV